MSQSGQITQTWPDGTYNSDGAVTNIYMQNTIRSTEKFSKQIISSPKEASQNKFCVQVHISLLFNFDSGSSSKACLTKHKL